MNALVTPTATFINPLDAPVDRIDDAIAEMVNAAVSHVEGELKRLSRRREAAAAVRHILEVRKDLEQAVAEAGGQGLPELGASFIDGCRGDLVAAFQIVNPSATPEYVGTVVDKLLDGYRSRLVSDEEPAKKRKK